jgi:uncharacterized membrane protein
MMHAVGTLVLILLALLQLFWDVAEWAEHSVEGLGILIFIAVGLFHIVRLIVVGITKMVRRWLQLKKQREEREERRRPLPLPD